MPPVRRTTVELRVLAPISGSIYHGSVGPAMDADRIRVALVAATLAVPPAPAMLDAVYVRTPVLVYAHLPVWPVGGLCDRSS